MNISPGTNRFAILIDGYVFKIAMDKDGIRDNLAEFSMAQELQPFVIKVYECNGLIIVCEYVTVISKEEFIDSKDEIRHILSFLAQGYLLGDVGTIAKNFMNWGYRSDNSLVILDFAYIYRVLGEEMLCGGLNEDGSTCTEMLEYDQNFNNLICPKCRKTYTFHEIRRKISRDYENKELNSIKQIAFKVNHALTSVNAANPVISKKEDNDGGKDTMGKKNKFHEDNSAIVEETYVEAIEFMKKIHSGEGVQDEEVDEIKTNVVIDMEKVEETIDEFNEDLPVVDESINTELQENQEIVESDPACAEVESSNIHMQPNVISAPVIVNTAPIDISVTVAETETTIITSAPDKNEDVQNINLRNILAEDLQKSENTVVVSNNDTIVLTTPNNVDEMKSFLASDDIIDPYEHMYDEIKDSTVKAKFNSKKKTYYNND